jgi:hypothetical protein
MQTSFALERLKEMRSRMSSGVGIANMLPVVSSNFSVWGMSLTSVQIRDEDIARGREPWFASLTPTTWSVVDLAAASERVMAEFEAKRRGTVLQLELAAYQLEHGHLPPSLDAPEVTLAKPLDPYSGDQFRYFPVGMPAPPTEQRQSSRPRQPWTAPLEFDVPCVWCTGPALRVRPVSANAEISEDPPRPRRSDAAVYYTLRTSDWDAPQLPFHTAWSYGMWFPIPEPKK